MMYSQIIALMQCGGNVANCYLKWKLNYEMVTFFVLAIVKLSWTTADRFEAE